MTASSWIASILIDFSQQTPFHARGGYSDVELAERGTVSAYPQAEQESARVNDFFEFFNAHEKPDLSGKDVLDFGCGYGGRTVEYALMGATRVYGVEPFPHVIARCTSYAASRGVSTAEFRTCGQDSIPLPDASVDMVLSYDVLEHVNDPRTAMRNILRVLRPGGVAYMIFPVYLGAFSHHLDYITLLPGLHWFFSADTLIGVVNAMRRHNNRLARSISEQPAAKVGFDGSRKVLPQLNGLGGRHFHEVFAGFEVRRIHRHGLLMRRRPRTPVMNALSLPIVPVALQDMLTFSVSCILRKPGPARNSSAAG